ncbi:MAG: tail fiber protein [Flavobacteriaceae bacterium]|nr:tail fiber protein [Flavobacteriaceae bacterium]
MNHPNSSLLNTEQQVGAIIAFSGNVASYKTSLESTNLSTNQSIESEWMLCDGSALYAGECQELYMVIGTLYGSSDSEKGLMFNLPDYRGQFLRHVGTDEASSVGHTVAKEGTDTGVGSTQIDALQTHEHMHTGIPEDMPNTPSVKVSAFETRPENMVVNYLIKYTHKF